MKPASFRLPTALQFPILRKILSYWATRCSYPSPFRDLIRERAGIPVLSIFLRERPQYPLTGESSLDRHGECTPVSAVLYLKPFMTDAFTQYLGLRTRKYYPLSRKAT